MAHKLNTHYYDGKLNARFNSLKNSNNNEVVSLAVCWKEIKDLIKSRLQKKRLEVALMIWKKMKSDVGRKANFDQKSRLRVRNVLPLVWTLVRKWDDSGKDLFLEQWIDIKGGMCPQGRIARLMQMACFETSFSK